MNLCFLTMYLAEPHLKFIRIRIQVSVQNSKEATDSYNGPMTSRTVCSSYWAKMKTLTGKGKVVSMLNQAPIHEGVRDSGGIASRILNHGTRWR